MKLPVLGTAILLFTSLQASADTKKMERAGATPVVAADKLPDETLTVPAQVTRPVYFDLKERSAVTIAVNGLQDTKKGFVVRVIPAALARAYFEKKVTDKGLDDVGPQMPVSGDNPTYRVVRHLPAKEWAVLIANTNNIFKSMMVRVTITATPEPSAPSAAVGE